MCVIFLWAFITPSESKFSLYHLGVLFLCLRITGTLWFSDKQRNLPLIFDSALYSCCQSCHRAFSGSGSASVPFLVCRNLSSHGSPIARYSLLSFTTPSYLLEALSFPQVLPGVRHRPLLFVEATTPSWDRAAFLSFATSASASLLQHSLLQDSREFAFKLLPQRSLK